VSTGRSTEEDVTMRVSALIGDAVVFVSPGANLLDVAEVLTSNEVGAVAVGDGTRPIAVVSERDIVHALARRLPPDTTAAIDVGQRELVWCDVSSTIRTVAAEMMDRYVRHVLVERDGNLVGIVSVRDVLGAYVANDSSVLAPET
jgi:CBS domain-containing protein